MIQMKFRFDINSDCGQDVSKLKLVEECSSLCQKSSEEFQIAPAASDTGTRAEKGPRTSFQAWGDNGCIQYLSKSVENLHRHCFRNNSDHRRELSSAGDSSTRLKSTPSVP